MLSNVSRFKIFSCLLRSCFHCKWFSYSRHEITIKTMKEITVSSGRFATIFVSQAKRRQKLHKIYEKNYLSSYILKQK